MMTRAAQPHQTGHMRPAGCVFDFEIPVEDSLNQKERREIEQKNDVIENISKDKLTLIF